MEVGKMNANPQRDRPTRVIFEKKIVSLKILRSFSKVRRVGFFFVCLNENKERRKKTSGRNDSVERKKKDPIDQLEEDMKSMG